MKPRTPLHPDVFSLLVVVILAAIAIPSAHAFQVCPVQPCRILDTRLGSGDAFGGAPHRLSPNETMSIDATEGFIAGQGGASNCGIPFPEATGVFINVVAVQPTGNFNNHLKVYPYNSAEPGAATMSYEPGSFALANGVFVALCTLASPSGTGCGDDLSITNGPSASTDVVIDVTGYAAASCL
jgi:hypothetical protein